MPYYIKDQQKGGISNFCRFSFQDKKNENGKKKERKRNKKRSRQFIQFSKKWHVFWVIKFYIFQGHLRKLENFLSFFPFWIMMKINLTFLFWRRTFLWGIIHKKIFWGVFILMELLKKFEFLDRTFEFYIIFKLFSTTWTIHNSCSPITQHNLPKKKLTATFLSAKIETILTYDHKIFTQFYWNWKAKTFRNFEY